MTPRERLLATARGDWADRVPLFLEGFHFTSADEINETAKRKIFERISEQIHFFHSIPSYINRYLVTPPQCIKTVSQKRENGNVTTTSVISTPKGKLTAVTSENTVSRTLWTIKYPVETLVDIEKIRLIRWELPEELVPPGLANLPAGFNARGIVHTGVSSPFVCVAGMMPYDTFLEFCASELNLLRELSEQCMERILRILDVLLAQNTIEWVWMGGCEWITPPMASAEIYDALVQQFEKPVIARIHAAGAISHVHCHGNVRTTLEKVIARGGDFFEPVEPPPDGDISFAEAKALANGRITLAGNIESRILENDNAAAVERATRAAFEGGKYRMVLRNTACPISLMTPRMIQNYHRLIDVWEELSPI
ncbi:hypothetical protein JXJ21_08755 [candidate division KSB1 bacterium]|nr:hypothetical protein [candidate division KSB1 bacterium]